MRGYIPTLDGWRAVAIGLVIVYHAMTGMFPKGSTEYFLIGQGAKGVAIFFALSGFLITTRLLDERDAFNQIGIRKFYLRRAFRILPPYLLYLASLAMMAAAGVLTVSSREWLGSVLFFQRPV